MQFLESLNVSLGGRMGLILSGIIIIAIVLMIASSSSKYNERLTTKALVYSAICIALAVVFSYFKIFKMPQGGSVCILRMFFITLIGYWYGPRAGIISGIVNGLLELIIDPYILHPVQFLTDYILAFGALGISGFFRKTKNGLLYGYIAGCFGRFFFTWLSGVVFFYSYAGGDNIFLYSLVYNASYFIPEMCITTVVILIPSFQKAVNLISKNTVRAC